MCFSDLNIVLCAFFLNSSIGCGHPELKNSKPIDAKEVLRLEILHDSIDNEKGDNASRLLKIEQRVKGHELLVYLNEKILARLGVPSGVKVGSPIWTKDGLWLMIKTFNGFDTRPAAVAYCDFNSENPEFQFFQRSIKKNGVSGQILNILGGDNEKVECVCAFKPVQESDFPFHTGTIPKKDLQPMTNESLDKIFNSHKNPVGEARPRKRQYDIE